MITKFLEDMSAWLKEGRVKYKEDVTDGLENAPQELIGLLCGKNFGKKIIRVSDDPSDTSRAVRTPISQPTNINA